MKPVLTKVYESYGGMIHNNETVGDPCGRYVSLSDYRALEAEREAMCDSIEELCMQNAEQAARIEKLEAMLDGPGTVTARWKWLLDELEQRFPSTTRERLSSRESPEQCYLRKIDAALAADREIERLTRERMMELVCPWCGSADLPATNCCDEQGRQRSGRITRAEYLRGEEERMSGTWRCEGCGEIASALDPSFRWAGDRWQHSHPTTQGAFDCRYFGAAERREEER